MTRDTGDVVMTGSPCPLSSPGLRSDDDKLSSESEKQREDFHSDYFCQTDGSHLHFPHMGETVQCQ